METLAGSVSRTLTSWSLIHCESWKPLIVPLLIKNTGYFGKTVREGFSIMKTSMRQLQVTSESSVGMWIAWGNIPFA